MLKKLFTQASLYGLSHILTRVINYILVPLHTSIFIASDYGLLSQFYVWAALLNIIYTFGLETTYFRFASKRSISSQKTFQHLYSFLLILSICLSGILILFSQQISTLLGYGSSESIYISLFACILLADTLISLPFSRLRLENKALKFVSLKLGSVLINVGLNFYFLSYSRGFEKLFSFENMDSQIVYVFVSNLLASLFLFIYFLPSLKYIRPHTIFSIISNGLLRKYLLYSFPLVLGGIAFGINELIDRILLEKWLPEGFYGDISNLAAVGIYSACYKLSIFITIAVQAFKYAAEPFFLKQAADKNAPLLFAKIMEYFVLFCALALLGVWANLNWLSDIFLGQKIYKKGLSIVPVLLLANIFLGIYYNLSIWFKHTDKTYWSAIIGGLGVLVTLIMNYLLIPILGYMGCAIATLICYFTMSAVSYYLGKRYFPIPYRLNIILSYLVLSIVLGYTIDYIATLCL